MPGKGQRLLRELELILGYVPPHDLDRSYVEDLLMDYKRKEERLRLQLGHKLQMETKRAQSPIKRVKRSK